MLFAKNENKVDSKVPTGAKMPKEVDGKKIRELQQIIVTLVAI